MRVGERKEEEVMRDEGNGPEDVRVSGVSQEDFLRGRSSLSHQTSRT